MTDYYQTGQFKGILPYLTETPDWFILAGPADGDEAQCARAEWPEVKILGLEPCIETWTWQLDHGWPKGAALLPRALSDVSGRVRLSVTDDPHGGPMQKYRTAHTRRADEGREVTASTLDDLDLVFGPFTNTLLWLDIEGAELAALQGATSLFARGAVSAVAVECLDPGPFPKPIQPAQVEKNRRIDLLLRVAGLRYAGMNEYNGNDRVYVRDR